MKKSNSWMMMMTINWIFFVMLTNNYTLTVIIVLCCWRHGIIVFRALIQLYCIHQYTYNFVFFLKFNIMTFEQVNR